jgi:hypothetical protein
MVAGTYFLITVLLAVIALIARPIRRWFRGRQKPLRSVGLLAGAWLVVLIVLVAVFPAPPRTSQNTIQSAADTAGTSQPTASSATSAASAAPVMALHCAVRSGAGQPLPDPVCTPGATNPAVTDATLASTICLAGWTATVRPDQSLTDSLKQQQIREYGYFDTNRADYEEDHLIPLELGGAPADPKNLWPEAGGIPNPKDGVENALKQAVCDHRVDLAAAQRAIAQNWVTARSVLGLETPAPTTATQQAPPVVRYTPAPPPTTYQQPASVAPPTSPSQGAACPVGDYRNVDGTCIQRPTQAPTAPAGATAKCMDGTYSFSQHRSGTCSGHGGVAAWL